MTNSDTTITDPKTAVNDVLALLNRRWTLRVIQELQHDRLTFRDLQAACGGISPTVLNSRLKELREAGLIDHQTGYGLTARGKTLLIALKPLHDWALGEVMNWNQ